MSRFFSTTGDGTFLFSSLTGTRVQYTGLVRTPCSSGVATPMAASKNGRRSSSGSSSSISFDTRSRDVALPLCIFRRRAQKAA
jgi:hypothetical protein